MKHRAGEDGIIDSGSSISYDTLSDQNGINTGQLSPRPPSSPTLNLDIYSKFWKDSGRFPNLGHSESKVTRQPARYLHTLNST